jgi:hypothetical protein
MPLARRAGRPRKKRGFCRLPIAWGGLPSARWPVRSSASIDVRAATGFACQWRRPQNPLERESTVHDSAVLKLLFLGAAAQGGDGGVSAADRLRHVVEVTGADFALVLGGCVATAFRSKLRLL